METLENSDMCRLCGKNSGISVNIFDRKENHVQKIHSILPILVHEMDTLPKIMCHRCSYKLEEFYKFYMNCAKTDTELKSKLSWMSKDNCQEKIITGAPMVKLKAFNVKSEPSEQKNILPVRNMPGYVVNNSLMHFFPSNSNLLIDESCNKSSDLPCLKCQCNCRKSIEIRKTSPISNSSGKDVNNSQQPHSSRFMPTKITDVITDIDDISHISGQNGIDFVDNLEECSFNNNEVSSKVSNFNLREKQCNSGNNNKSKTNTNNKDISLQFEVLKNKNMSLRPRRSSVDYVSSKKATQTSNNDKKIKTRSDVNGLCVSKQLKQNNISAINNLSTKNSKGPMSCSSLQNGSNVTVPTVTQSLTLPIPIVKTVKIPMPCLQGLGTTKAVNTFAQPSTSKSYASAVKSIPSVPTLERVLKSGQFTRISKTSQTKEAITSTPIIKLEKVDDGTRELRKRKHLDDGKSSKELRNKKIATDDNQNLSVQNHLSSSSKEFRNKKNLCNENVQSSLLNSNPSVIKELRSNKKVNQNDDVRCTLGTPNIVGTNREHRSKKNLQNDAIQVANLNSNSVALNKELRSKKGLLECQNIANNSNSVFSNKDLRSKKNLLSDDVQSVHTRSNSTGSKSNNEDVIIDFNELEIKKELVSLSKSNEVVLSKQLDNCDEIIVVDDEPEDGAKNLPVTNHFVKLEKDYTCNVDYPRLRIKRHSTTMPLKSTIEVDVENDSTHHLRNKTISPITTVTKEPITESKNLEEKIDTKGKEHKSHRNGKVIKNKKKKLSKEKKKLIKENPMHNTRSVLPPEVKRFCDFCNLSFRTNELYKLHPCYQK